MKFAVSGASGFLGCYVMNEIDRRGHAVVAWARRKAPNCITIDITQRDSVADAIAKHRPNAIINLAAVSDISTCKQDPELGRAINTIAAGEIAGLAVHHCLRLVYVSTDQVFDGSHGMWREEDEGRPLHLYGKLKLQGEREVAAKYPEAIIVRPSLITGKVLNGRRSSTSALLHALKSGKRPRMFTDEFRSPIAASEVARVLVDLAENPNITGMFHCGGPEVLTRYELACREAETAEFDSNKVIPTTREEMGLASERPADLSLDSSRLVRVLGRILHR